VLLALSPPPLTFDRAASQALAFELSVTASTPDIKPAASCAHASAVDPAVDRPGGTRIYSSIVSSAAAGRTEAPVAAHAKDTPTINTALRGRPWLVWAVKLGGQSFREERSPSWLGRFGGVRLSALRIG